MNRLETIGHEIYVLGIEGTKQYIKSAEEEVARLQRMIHELRADVENPPRDLNILKEEPQLMLEAVEEWDKFLKQKKQPKNFSNL